MTKSRGLTTSAPKPMRVARASGKVCFASLRKISCHQKRALAGARYSFLVYIMRSGSSTELASHDTPNSASKWPVKRRSILYLLFRNGENFAAENWVYKNHLFYDFGKGDEHDRRLK